jgi:hypothetical protein
MNAAQACAAALVVASAVSAFLLTQPDTIIGPLAKAIIGAINVGSTALALYLKVDLPGRNTPS